MTLIVNVGNLQITPLGYTNNTVSVSLIKTKTDFKIIDPIIARQINQMFGDGVNLGTWLTNHGLGFLDLTQLVISEGNGYLYIEFTP